MHVCLGCDLSAIGAHGADITEKKETEDLVWLQANYDPLTKLPNRRLFGDRLQQEIRKAMRERRYLGLLFLDLDQFKHVNDTLGHRFGDALLIEASQRISQCLRKTDTVARLGGDEFTAIITELSVVTDLDEIAQSIIAALCLPFMLGCDQAYVSVSIGIAIYPTDAENGEDLLRYADQAMYAAKNQGRGGYCYFTPAMQKAARQRMVIANDLHKALVNAEFQVYYQPIVDLESGQIRKAEALLRWRHPQQGLVMPGDFISIAEEIGLIDEIGDWLFFQVVQQVKIWRSLYGPDFQISFSRVIWRMARMTWS